MKKLLLVMAITGFAGGLAVYWGGLRQTIPLIIAEIGIGLIFLDF